MKKTPLPKLTIAEKDRIYNFKSHHSWGIKDPDRFKQLMNEVVGLVEPGAYLGDNLFAWMRNLSLLDDTAFRQAWQSNIITEADKAIAWRRYVLCCAAFHCVHLEGDFVECGVLHGTGVKTVIDYFGKNAFAKQFWAYDTFDSDPTGHSTVQKEGLFDKVRERFAGYENIRLVRGLLPGSLEGNSPERIAYLHIDMNNAEFEIAVLDRLFDKVVTGGIVVLDDYEWAGVFREQKIAEDAWFAEREYRVFPLPTGQGLVLKR